MLIVLIYFSQFHYCYYIENTRLVLNIVQVYPARLRKSKITRPSILFILPFQWLKQNFYIFIFKTDYFPYFEIINTLGYLAILFRRYGSFFQVASNTQMYSSKPLLQSEKLNTIKIWSLIQFFFLYFFNSFIII